jgi:hypothetical protein
MSLENKDWEKLRVRKTPNALSQFEAPSPTVAYARTRMGHMQEEVDQEDGAATTTEPIINEDRVAKIAEKIQKLNEQLQNF